jgi:ABC-2 type transport system ATP-binding protein
MDDEMIKFKGVTKKFGRCYVLEDINISIPENKVTGIIGASGEGKTTILKLLARFYKPTKGDIFYSKRKISKEKELKKILGFSTEDGSFHTRLTVLENLYHFGSLHHLRGKEIKQRAKEILEFVDLEYAKDTLAGNLSMGMKKRLDVAISLMHKPPVLIMDEPTADLDPLLRNKMLELIKRINKEGTTIILTTQILTEMDKICDKIAILFDKKIIEEGSPSKIKKKYSVSNLDEVFNKIFSKGEKIKKKEIKNKIKKAIKEKKKEIGELTQKQIDLIEEKVQESAKK